MTGLLDEWCALVQSIGCLWLGRDDGRWEALNSQLFVPAHLANNLVWWKSTLCMASRG